ncbi:MAG: hypothetical protein E7439_01915 [Ruminococcaceae bacterium]|nr:hypothetical protein [Oscillospiraceae bacterium]
MKLKDYFKQLKIDLAPMTFGQKVDHIWTYNKELILITIGVLVLVVALLTAFLSKPDVVFSGYILNINLSEEGTAYLSTGFRDVVDASGKKTVELNSGIYNPESANAGETSYTTVIQLSALCSDQSLDYMITDESALQAQSINGLCMDLQDFFSEEEFAQWKDRILYVKTEEGSSVPVGVNISETKFAEACVTSHKAVYLSFIVNTKNPDLCRQLWNHILSYQ